MELISCFTTMALIGGVCFCFPEEKALIQTLHQDSLTGGAEINFRGFEKFIYMNSRGVGGTRNLFQQCGSNEQGEDQKKVFSLKISTNSSYCVKILAIFHEFLGEDKKKRSSFQNFYEIRCESTNYENTGGKHQCGSLRPRFALQ